LSACQLRVLPPQLSRWEFGKQRRSGLEERYHAFGWYFDMPVVIVVNALEVRIHSLCGEVLSGQ
jgi:hypothetical protein